jgi:phosphoglycolate phosphatase
VPANDPETLRRLLADARALLLDFDGPVCQVFAGLSAQIVADELRQILTAAGVQLPAELATAGPHELLTFTGRMAPDLVHQVETHLTAREVEAVVTAEPTAGTTEFIQAWRKTGRPLVIVSNNAELAVRAYLTGRGLSPYVDHVVGRDLDDASLMKPSPYLLYLACAWLVTIPQQCVLIGDSASDLQAAGAAKVPAIAYANKPHKSALLLRHRPAGLVHSMNDLGALLA